MEARLECHSVGQPDDGGVINGEDHVVHGDDDGDHNEPKQDRTFGGQGNSKYFSKLLKMEYIFFGDEGNSKYFSKSTLFLPVKIKYL